MKHISAELIAILAVGVTLAGLILVGQHRLEDRLLAGQHRLEDRLLAVEKEQARMLGLLEGIGLAGQTGKPGGQSAAAPAPQT